MATDKATKLSLIEKHPDFLLEVMTFGANSMLKQLLKDDLIKKDKNGKRPNQAHPPHPAVIQLLRRDIELQLDLTGINH